MMSSRTTIVRPMMDSTQAIPGPSGNPMRTRALWIVTMTQATATLRGHNNVSIRTPCMRVLVREVSVRAQGLSRRRVHWFSRLGQESSTMNLGTSRGWWYRHCSLSGT